MPNNQHTERFVKDRAAKLTLNGAKDIIDQEVAHTCDHLSRLQKYLAYNADEKEIMRAAAKIQLDRYRMRLGRVMQCRLSRALEEKKDYDAKHPATFPLPNPPVNEYSETSCTSDKDD